MPRKGASGEDRVRFKSKHQKTDKNFYGVCVFTLLSPKSAYIFSLSLSLFFPLAYFLSLLNIWTLSITLVKILKDDAVSVALNMPANWETQHWPQDWKRSVFIPVPKKDNAKNCSNYSTIMLISPSSKVMFKILQAKFQQYLKWEPPDVQDGFTKDRGTGDQIASICWIIEKAREFQKNINFCFIDYAKACTV